MLEWKVGGVGSKGNSSGNEVGGQPFLLKHYLLIS